MEKYVYVNPHAERNEIKKEKNEPMGKDERQKTGKTKVVKYIPTLLKEALDELSLSRIMMNKAKKLVCLILQRSLQEHEDASEFIHTGTATRWRHHLRPHDTTPKHSKTSIYLK